MSHTGSDLASLGDGDVTCSIRVTCDERLYKWLPNNWIKLSKSYTMCILRKFLSKIMSALGKFDRYAFAGYQSAYILPISDHLY